MNNLENNFVPKQIAIDMRSIGFDEPCFGFYIGDIIRLTLYTDCGWKNSTIPYDTQEELLTTPLYQQCFRWFREKYNLKGHVEAVEYLDGTQNTYHWCIFNKYNSGYDQLTYEEAELECLKKLIEIVKNK